MSGVVVVAAAVPCQMDVGTGRMLGLMIIGPMRMGYRSPSEKEMNQHNKNGCPSHAEASSGRKQSI